MIVDRPDYSWPDGKRLAVYLGLNIEHFAFGAGEGHLLTVAGAAPIPGPSPGAITATGLASGASSNCSDELNPLAAHLINTAVFDYAPRIVDALKARGDEFIGHGRTNAERHNHSHMWEADERRSCRRFATLIERASESRREAGWRHGWRLPTTRPIS